MNAIALTGMQGWISCIPVTFGSSEYAKKTEQCALNAEAYFTSSQILKSPSECFLEELWTIARNCSVDDWDGYSAKAISKAAIINAANFYLSELRDMPLPEISPEPDGELALEWFGKDRSSFSISFGESDNLSYACLAGKRVTRGIEPVDSPNIELFEILIREISNP